MTAHHLEINRNHLLVGGIRHHLYCLPVAKRERHRLALRKAVTSGNPKFSLGEEILSWTFSDLYVSREAPDRLTR